MESAKGDSHHGDQVLELSGIEQRKTSRRILQELAMKFKKQVTTNIKQA